MGMDMSSRYATKHRPTGITGIASLAALASLGLALYFLKHIGFGLIAANPTKLVFGIGGLVYLTVAIGVIHGLWNLKSWGLWGAIIGLAMSVLANGTTIFIHQSTFGIAHLIGAILLSIYLYRQRTVYIE